MAEIYQIVAPLHLYERIGLKKTHYSDQDAAMKDIMDGLNKIGIDYVISSNEDIGEGEVIEFLNDSGAELASIHTLKK